MNLSEINLNDFDLREAGDWPWVGKIVLVVLVIAAVLGAGYYFFTSDRLEELDRVTREEQQYLIWVTSALRRGSGAVSARSSESASARTTPTMSGVSEVPPSKISTSCCTMPRPRSTECRSPLSVISLPRMEMLHPARSRSASSTASWWPASSTATSSSSWMVSVFVPAPMRESLPGRVMTPSPLRECRRSGDKVGVGCRREGARRVEHRRLRVGSRRSVPFPKWGASG